MVRHNRVGVCRPWSGTTEWADVGHGQPQQSGWNKAHVHNCPQWSKYRHGCSPHWKMGIMVEGNTAVQAIPSSDALVRKVGANNRYDAQLWFSGPLAITYVLLRSAAFTFFRPYNRTSSYSTLLYYKEGTVSAHLAIAICQYIAELNDTA